MSDFFKVVRETKQYYYNGNGTKIYLQDMDDRQIVSAVNTLQDRITNLNSTGSDILRPVIRQYDDAISSLLGELGSRQ